MRKLILATIAVVLLIFAVSIYYYPSLPEKLASHWDAKGVANGYSSRAFGVFFVPVLSILMFLLLFYIPKLDPLKKNILEFQAYYDGFLLVMMLFFFYIHLLTLFWNMEYKFDMIQFMIPAFGILFFYLGIMVKKAKRNWFIGIRTPWTLSSDEVWDKTHKASGKLFMIAGVLILFGIFMKDYAIYLLLGLVMGVGIFSVVYSYFVFKKIGKKN